MCVLREETRIITHAYRGDGIRACFLARRILKDKCDDQTGQGNRKSLQPLAVCCELDSSVGAGGPAAAASGIGTAATRCAVGGRSPASFVMIRVETIEQEHFSMAWNAIAGRTSCAKVL